MRKHAAGCTLALALSSSCRFIFTLPLRRPISVMTVPACTAPATNGELPPYRLRPYPPLELFVPPSFQSHFVSRVVIGFLSIRAPPLF